MHHKKSERTAHMTANPKVPRYHTRRVQRRAILDEGAAAELVLGNDNEGSVVKEEGREEETSGPSLPEDSTALTQPSVGTPERSSQPILPSEGSEPQRSIVQPTVLKAETPEEIEATLAGIAAERHSNRHLRRALEIAKIHELKPKSAFDAVRLLREAGVNPFSLASMVRPVRSDSVAGSAAKGPSRSGRLGTALVRLPGDEVKLPKRVRPWTAPSNEQYAEVNQATEILRMQQEIGLRRRRKLRVLAARLFALVLLPTLIAGWYFYSVATPMYSVQSEIIIQQAGSASSGASLGGLFSGSSLGTSQDSNAVQGYLQSLEAMSRLDADLGFREHFQSNSIDPLQRLSPDATLEEAYGAYKKFVRPKYDEKDGVIRMEVIAADPEVAAEWSRQLITYAEGQVNQLTERLRADQMRDAQEAFDAAQAALAAAKGNMVELQEKFQTISSKTAVDLIVMQIRVLENQITQERLSLMQMESNSAPSKARMEPIKRRIATMQARVSELRAGLTEDSATDTSLAVIQGQLLVAQSDIDNRQMLLAEALLSINTARIEANRQQRYLSLSVSPIPPDEPTYPRSFENIVLTLLILLGAYWVISMSASYFREQVSE